jgi:hypothetical protein
MASTPGAELLREKYNSHPHSQLSVKERLIIPVITQCPTLWTKVRDPDIKEQINKEHSCIVILLEG